MRPNGKIATTAKSSDGLLPVNVEIFDHDKVWGRLELTFAPDAGYPHRELLALFIFVTASCMLGFILFMKRTLHILDPSQVIPERVRAMLDTLAEGAAIVDGDGRIVLANQSLAGMLSTAPINCLACISPELPWVNLQLSRTAIRIPAPSELPWDDFSDKVDCRGKMVQLQTESRVAIARSSMPAAYWTGGAASAAGSSRSTTSPESSRKISNWSRWSSSLATPSSASRNKTRNCNGWRPATP